jgi:hypothetical protein
MKLKAISEVLAVLILVVLSMVVGALFYVYVSSMTSQIVPVDEAFVSVEGLTPPQSSRTFFTFTVKDVGTASIVKVHFIVNTPTPVSSSVFHYPIAPGQEENVVLNVSYLSPGLSYTYSASVLFSNGVNKTYSGTVTIQS